MDNFRFLYNKVTSLNFAHILVLGLVVKAIVSDISVASFLISLPVLGYEGYKLYVRSKTPDPIKINEEVVKELDNIKAKLNATAMEKSVKPLARW
jgi:hypothetical protein